MEWQTKIGFGHQSHDRQAAEDMWLRKDHLGDFKLLDECSPNRMAKQRLGLGQESGDRLARFLRRFDGV
jgi:hypothetical protein